MRGLDAVEMRLMEEWCAGPDEIRPEYCRDATPEEDAAELRLVARGLGREIDGCEDASGDCTWTITVATPFGRFMLPAFRMASTS